MITTCKNQDDLAFISFNSTDDFPSETRHALLQVRDRVGCFEYAQLKNGKWCIRTMPTQLYELPLAAISSDLANAAKRILIFTRLGEIG